MQSLTFNVNLPSAGQYYLGVQYSALSSVIPIVTIALDGITQFGSITTLNTASLSVNSLVQSSLAANVAAGAHSLTFTVQAGNLHLYQFILTNGTSVYSQGTFSVGSVATYASQITSCVGTIANATNTQVAFTAGTGKPTIANTCNWCPSSYTPSNDDWCFNSVIKGVYSTANYAITVPAATDSSGFVFLGLKYKATTQANLGVQVDGQDLFYNPIGLPPTGNVYTVISPFNGFNITAGKHILTLTVKGGTTFLSQFAIMLSPLQQPTAAPTTAVTVSPTGDITPTSGGTTTSGSPTAQQINVQDNSNAIVLDTGAIIGIAIGGAIFVIGVIVGIVIATRKNKAKPTKEEKKGAAKTPALEKAVDGKN